MPRNYDNLRVRERTPQDRLWNRLLDELQSRDAAYAFQASQLVERAAHSLVTRHIPPVSEQMIPALTLMQITCVQDLSSLDSNGQPQGVCDNGSLCSIGSPNVPPYDFTPGIPIPPLVYKGQLLRWKVTAGVPEVDNNGRAVFEPMPIAAPIMAFDAFGVLTQWYALTVNPTQYNPCDLIGLRVVVCTSRLWLEGWSWQWVIVFPDLFF